MDNFRKKDSLSLKKERAVTLRELYHLLLSANLDRDYKKMQQIVVSNPKFYNLDVKATNTLKQNVKFYSSDRFHIAIIEKIIADLKIDMECAEKIAESKLVQTFYQ